jgi:peptide/nickel transport system permease protein
MLSGYIGGAVDQLFMRVIDLFMAMPSFIVALAIAGTLGASGKNLVLAMSCVYWASYARLSRALTIQMKEQNFVMALKAGGCTNTRILFAHILKNIAPSIIALATMEFGSVILSIAGFSFIGLGVQAPTPEWGIMLSDSKNYIQTYPQLMMYPGIAIVIVVMAFNLLGDGIKHGIS